MHALSYLQGYLMGDGTVRPDQVVLCGTSDDEIRVVACMKDLGMEPNLRYFGPYSGRTRATFRITWPQKFRPLLGDISGHRQGSPPTYQDPASFVTGLWDADGCVYHTNTRSRFECGISLSASREALLKAAKHALLEIGIESHFTYGKNHRGEPDGSLRILRSAFPRFMELISLQKKKQLKLERIRGELGL